MMRLNKFITLSLLLVATFAITHAQQAKSDNYNLLIGTYTKPGKSEGIYVYSFNVKTGDTAFKSVATGISNPSYLAISKDRKKVYSVSEAGRGKGSISAF